MMGTYGAPSQVWEAGFNGLYNNEDYLDPVTSKIGMPSDPRETRKEKLHKAKMQKRFERDVMSRAEMFKSAFAKFDIDNDGRLSYKEFSKGLQELGVKLPEHEMRAIWSEEANGKPWKAMEDHVASFSGHLPQQQDQYHGNEKARVGARSLRIPSAHDKYTTPKIDVEERSRNAVQRRMMAQFAHRENDLKKTFESHTAAKARRGVHEPDRLNFSEYQQCLKDLGALLSEEDLGHLWDTCKQQSTAESDFDGQTLSFEQLSSALGTQKPPVVADSAVDKSIQRERTASLAREKLLRQLREKKHQLSNSFLISDEHGTGTLGLGDFKSCLKSSGLFLGDEDCKAVLEACDAGSSESGIAYNKVLSAVLNSEQENLERLVSTPAPSRLLSSSTAPETRQELLTLASPVPPYHSDHFDHSASAPLPVAPGSLTVADGSEASMHTIGQSLQEQLPELKRIVGQRAGRPETDAPVSIWGFRQKMAELGVQVDGEVLRNLYERARVDFQGRIDCDLLAMDAAAPEGHPGVLSNIFNGETPENPGRRSHPFTPKVPRDPSNVSRLVEKIASSRIGNPFKLATMFRKYDEFPRHNRCSVEEFVQVVMDGAVGIPRAEAAALAERIVAPDGQIDYLHFVNTVRDARKRERGDLALEVSFSAPSLPAEGGGEEQTLSAPASSAASPVKQKLAFGAPVHAVIDRASWIEDVVSNSMTDLNRFERQRIRALTGPPSTGTKILHVRVPPSKTRA